MNCRGKVYKTEEPPSLKKSDSMATTLLGGAVEFLEKLGIYDVVLPFLLVFTVLFALLERTAIFGYEKMKIADEMRTDLTKKNLNAMVAFVVAFFVVASSRVVETITAISSNMVILMLLVVFLLVLASSFEKQGDGSQETKHSKVKIGGLLAIAFGMALIFLDGLKTEAGLSWLDVVMEFIKKYWNTSILGAIILVILVVGFVFFIAGGLDADPNTSAPPKGGK